MQKTETGEVSTIEPVTGKSLTSTSAGRDAAAGRARAEDVSAGIGIEGLGQPNSSRISRRELSKILELHLQWLASDQAEGEQADLSGAQLQGVDLTGADLRRAVMPKANLDGAELFMAQFQDASLAQANLARANLLGAQFQRADLRGANLDNTVGLQADQLAGAELCDAVLPASFSESAVIARVHKLSLSAATMLAAMLSLSGLVGARVATATDAQLIKNSPTLPLLHLGNAMPIMAFFLMAPVLLVGLYIAMHLRLFRLWEAVDSSPKIFPSGKELAECGPWPVIALGFDQFEWLRGRLSALYWLESLIAYFLTYWVPAVALVVVWARYLTFQDIHGAILDVFLVVTVIGLAIVLPLLNARTLLRHATLGESSKSLLENSAFRGRAALALGAGLMLSLLSLGAIYGSPHAQTGNVRSGATGISTWAAGVLWLVHIDPYANLSEQDISTKLPNAGRDDGIATAQGAHLRGRNLRHAQAYRAFLAKADLWDADLESADLSEADLQLADLHKSSLRWALLNHAQMAHANLEGSDLRGAQLFRANLSEANLSSALLGDAMLNEAQLDSANLYGADLHSSQLLDAGLEGADLRGANLEHANLADAKLRNSYLSSTKLMEADLQRANLEHAFLTQADLRHADLRGADLSGATVADADLSGANLEGADLRGASGLGVAQICSARINGGTQIDDYLMAQVNQSCPAK